MGGSNKPPCFSDDDNFSLIGAQLDGNESIFSDTLSVSSDNEHKIPVFTSKREKRKTKPFSRKWFNKTVKRSNKSLEALDLPIVVRIHGPSTTRLMNSIA